MPFENGRFRPTTPQESQDFLNMINQKVVSEVLPTPELVQAFAEQMAGPPPQPRKDLTRAIEKAQGVCDIVIPIYGSLHVVKECIASVRKNTNWPYHLILVDDASPDVEVKKYLGELEDFADAYFEGNKLTVLYNEVNRGFPGTVNRGVAAGDGKYICILNSDTLTTPGWLTNQLLALEDDARNAIVNPVTNNTALINVQMYNGQSYLDMAHALSVSPNTPTFNEIMPTGFCFTMRRKLWDEVGPFDEAFGSGYGEESSFWMHTLKHTSEDGRILDYRAVIADNAYVFHERGTSFAQLGEDKHMGMRKIGNERFHQLHPDYKEWIKGFNANDAVDHLRKELPREAFNREYKGHVAWVVKSATACGGMNFIADIVNELIEQGYDAKVCVVPPPETIELMEKEGIELPVTNRLHTAPLLFRSGEEFIKTFTERAFSEGIVLSAVTDVTPLVKRVADENKGLRAYNHVQSADMELARLQGAENFIPAILEQYRALPNIVSSGWIAQELRTLGATVVDTILPGVNPDLFHPRGTKGDGRQTIVVMMLEASHGASKFMDAVKGYSWGMEFLKALEPAKHPELRVVAVGPKSLPVRGVTCVGQLSQAKMADLLGTGVILVDPSATHSYGLPALEALSSGGRAITRNNRGVHEYAKDFGDRVRVTDDPKDAADTAICRGWGAGPIRSALHDREAAVKRFIHTLFPERQPGFKVEFVTPHMRKHGGPTTIISAAKQTLAAGHDVDLSMIYTDWNPEVLKMAKNIPVRTNWNEPQDRDVVVINSDNPFAEQIMAARPGAKFVMLKLSHNARFKKIENDNLNLPWDHIMTSTNWLRDVCLNPLPDWTHKAWDPDKVTVVGWYHYGHDLFAFPPEQRTYGTAVSGFKVGTLVHEHALKGTREAVASMNGLQKKYGPLVHLAGFGEIRANLPEWVQYIRSPGRKDMAHAFKQLDFWLGASHTEGLGRLALEAMSAGVAVVTTNTGAEFLRDGENCLLYNVGDAQRGAELIDMLANDQRLFTKIVVNGFKTAQAAANPDVFRANLNAVIRKVKSGTN